MSKKKHILELLESREASGLGLTNFLTNIYRPIALHEWVLSREPDNRAILAAARRAHTIALASVLETFYRDFYIYCLSCDRGVLESELAGVPAKPKLSDVHELQEGRASMPEIAAGYKSFQDIVEIESAISAAIPASSYLDELFEYRHLCHIPSRGVGARGLRAKPSWRRSLANLFEERHRLVHDANRPCPLTDGDSREFEEAALFIPQITTGLPGYIRSRAKGKKSYRRIPVVFTREDLVREDWVVVG